jgi:hypothetical protein
MNYLPPEEVLKMGAGLTIRMIKDTLDEELVLDSWTFTTVDYNRHYCADVQASASVNGKEGILQIRFSSKDPQGTIEVPGTPGADWYVALWSPNKFFVPGE